MLLVLCAICSLAQAQLRARDGCKERNTKCVLDGQETECYDDKSLVHFCGGPGNSLGCKIFPFQCGWNIGSLGDCTPGKPCRNYGRAGVCSQDGFGFQCAISDTACDSGDPWCYKDGDGGRCIGGVCTTAPLAPEERAKAGGAPPALCRTTAQTNTFKVAEGPEAEANLKLNIDAPLGVPVLLNHTAAISADVAVGLSVYVVKLEVLATPTQHCAQRLRGLSFQVEQSGDSINVQLRGWPSNLQLGTWQSEFEQDFRTAVVDNCLLQETEAGAASLSRSAAAQLATVLASAYVSRNGIVAPVVAAALGACSGVMAQNDSIATATTTLEATAVPQSTSPSSWNNFGVPTGSSVTACRAFVRVSMEIASEKLKVPCRSVVVNTHTSWSGDTSISTTPVGCLQGGRPFVADSEPVLSTATGTTENKRAARWVSQGLGEHASVASFAAFSLQLMVNGAPFSLLTGAAKANADEVRHAEQSFALASRFAGHKITAEPFPRHAIGTLQPQSLEELAEATLREGCIAETLSVFDAARRIDEADVTDEEEQSVLIGIVHDETRHAALAWRTVAWATGKSSNATLNQRLIALIAAEHARCHQSCDLFARLIVPLAARLIGSDNWQRIVESNDVAIVVDSSCSLQESTIKALLKTFL
jgi:hypothetical protein